MKNNNIIRIC